MKFWRFLPDAGCAASVIWILICLAGTIGYILDIIKLINCDFAAPYKPEVIYGIGAVTGLGAIFGWFNFGK